jgi:hypothetical protein
VNVTWLDDTSIGKSLPDPSDRTWFDEVNDVLFPTLIIEGNDDPGVRFANDDDIIIKFISIYHKHHPAK